MAKVVCKAVVDDMTSLFSPRQLGFGVCGGAEAAVHAARRYLSNMPQGRAMVKLDFRNAFNSIRRDCMLEAVQSLCPVLYPFVHSVYASPSDLKWGDRYIPSSEGVQQGDPLGSLLFCLTLHQHCLSLKSEFCVLYLDDVTMGGRCEDILHDIDVMKDAAVLGLSLNATKSEIISSDMATHDLLLCSLPGAEKVEPSNAKLLGSPLGDNAGVSNALSEKVEALKRLGERLRLLSVHDSLILLRNSFALPKLQYLLRTAPCFKSSYLRTYDDCLCEILSSVTNTPLGSNSAAWLQATLPVKLGGLGIRSASEVAPSAFLASHHATSGLVSAILPPSFTSPLSTSVADAVQVWAQGHDRKPPVGADACKQKSWDAIRTRASSDSLLQNASNEEDRARLLAVSNKESSAWLLALPISALGLRLDDESVRIAVGLRLGTAICGPHHCCHCGSTVDTLGRHALSCKRSKGRHHRHAALNEVISRALTSARIPSRLEPTGLLRTDGKRPDGISLVPWSSGKLLVWDATCPDTFAPSYRAQATLGPGEVAALAEARKEQKYASLPPNHSFTPVAIETMGTFGPRSLAFVKELGRRIRRESGEDKSTQYLLQRLSVAVQQGNCTAIMSAMSGS